MHRGFGGMRCGDGQPPEAFCWFARSAGGADAGTSNLLEEILLITIAAVLSGVTLKLNMPKKLLEGSV